MVRRFWLSKVEQALAARRIVWLSGVRRAGKTVLVKSIPGIHYFDCELARVRRALDDPELFWRDKRGVVALDEVHRLTNPSELLKIAADHFPEVSVVATGSSTLAAKKKFSDTLAGRKREVRLVPMIWSDAIDFGVTDLEHRFVRGGLPPFFLAPRLDDKDYEEWIDSYWAKDLSELFVVEKKSAFMKFMELVFMQSGGLFEAQSFTGPCEISRPTAQHYLSILETTLLATTLRPYFGGGATEIKSQPKVYAFDTGFVAYFKGWEGLRDEERGILLEHVVLGELSARFDPTRTHYWRDKQHHEVDFVVEIGRRRELLTIECKSSPAKFDPASLLAFRRRYPCGKNLVVTVKQAAPEVRRYVDVEVTFLPFDHLPAMLDGG
jgi:predicted AAA+ superfamily ATPase